MFPQSEISGTQTNVILSSLFIMASTIYFQFVWNEYYQKTKIKNKQFKMFLEKSWIFNSECYYYSLFQYLYMNVHVCSKNSRNAYLMIMVL